MGAGLARVVLGSLVLAAIATAGDFVWANWRVRHLAVYGVIHGIVMFAAAGMVVTPQQGRQWVGALGGMMAGAGGALSFYALRPMLGYGAMFASWVIVWGVLAYIARAGAVRGLVAALLSGAAFYAVSGMWMPFNPGGLADYAEHFVRWTIAFLPGFAALLVGRKTT